MDHEGLVLHELVQGGRRGDLLDFAFVLLLPEFPPEGIEGEFAGGFFFPCWGPCYPGRDRYLPVGRTWTGRRIAARAF